MAHSDDNGLILPPKLAPLYVVIIPIYKNDEQLSVITEKVTKIIAELKAAGITVKYDDSDQNKPGWKYAEYELKGVPVRMAIGMRDIENNTVEIARRDTKEKTLIKAESLGKQIKDLLENIQKNIYLKALEYRDKNLYRVSNWNEFITQIEKGGFISAHWDGTEETEQKIKEETKATIRCIQLDADDEQGECVYSGKPSQKRVLFARAY